MASDEFQISIKSLSKDLPLKYKSYHRKCTEMHIKCRKDRCDVSITLTYLMIMLSSLSDCRRSCSLSLYNTILLEKGPSTDVPNTVLEN